LGSITLSADDLESGESDKERDDGEYVEDVHDVTAEAALGRTGDKA